MIGADQGCPDHRGVPPRHVSAAGRFLPSAATTSTPNLKMTTRQIDGWELPQYDPSDGVRRASLHNPILTS
jgi:hypothetical protein